MTSPVREKFATQVNTEIMSAVRSLAQDEGRQLQAWVEVGLYETKTFNFEQLKTWLRGNVN